MCKGSNLKPQSVVVASKICIWQKGYLKEKTFASSGTKQQSEFRDTCEGKVSLAMLAYAVHTQKGKKDRGSCSYHCWMGLLKLHSWRKKGAEVKSEREALCLEQEGKELTCRELLGMGLDPPELHCQLEPEDLSAGGGCWVPLAAVSSGRSKWDHGTRRSVPSTCFSMSLILFFKSSTW